MTTATERTNFTPFSPSIPAGGRATPFDDQADAKGRRITGIASINVWVDKVVTGLQVTYTLASGKTYRAPVRGSQQGNKSRIVLEADEELIQLSARGNTGSITALTLLSTKTDGTVRLHGPYGDGEVAVKQGGEPVPYRSYELLVGGSDDKAFSWYGCKVMAFTGQIRSGRLAGLGVLTAPIVEGAQGVASTSVLGQEYRERVSGSRGRKKLEAYPSYRSIVTLPQSVQEVTLWAEEQLSVMVDGRSFTLDPGKPTVVQPNALSKLTISVEATDISVPAIKLRTDRMTDPWQWYSLHPDVAAHAKIAAWDVDTLYENRSKLGIPSKYTREDCAAIQAAVTNVAKLGLPGRGQGSHERQIDATNMDDANWMVDLEGEQLGYAAVSKSDAKKTKDQASTITKAAAASGLEKLEKKLRKKSKKAAGSVAKVVVETTKTKPVKAVTKAAGKAGGKVVDDAEDLGKNVAKSGQKIAKDVAEGDIVEAGKHLGQGGLQLGRDVTKLGKHTVVTVINVAGEAVEYVLDRTVALGRLMWDLLKTLGAKLKKLVDFLVDLIPWKAIAQTQKQLMGALEKSLGSLASANLDGVLAKIDGFFDQIREGGEKALDDLTLKLGGTVQASKGLQKAGEAASEKTKKLDDETGKAVSKAMKWLAKPLELINWLLNKLVQNIPGVGAITKVLSGAAKKVGAALQDLMSAAARALKLLPPAIGSSLSNLLAVVKDPAKAPNYIAAAMLQLVKGLMSVGVELVGELVGVALRQLQVVVQILVDVGTMDLFPGKKKKGGKVPLLTDFYDFIVGGNLSLFKLLTFLLAVPITLVSLAVSGSAPDLRLSAQRAVSKPKAKKVERDLAIAKGVFAGAQFLLKAFLDGYDLAKGNVADDPSTQGTQSSVNKGGVLRLLAEIATMTCGVLVTVFSNPLMLDPVPERDPKIADLAFYWVPVVLLPLDVFSLVKDGKQLVRADFAKDPNNLREGAALALAIKSVIVIAKVSTAAGTQRNVGTAFFSDLLGDVGGVVEALILTLTPASSPEAAVACIVSDVAFGTTALATGLAADLS